MLKIIHREFWNLMKPKWALISTYKIYEDPNASCRFLETFLNFYRQRWGITKFVLLFGIPHSVDKSCFRSIENRLLALEQNRIVSIQNLGVDKLPYLNQCTLNRNLSECDPSIDYLVYETSYSTRGMDWYSTQKRLYQFVDNYLGSNYNRILNVDSDEFLCYDYPNNPNVNELVKERFHFVDFVSSQSFDSKQDLRWCVQPWYFRKGLPKEEFEADGIHHGLCKTFRFRRRHFKANSYHSGASKKGDSCNMISTNHFEKVTGNICFHLNVLDREHYMKVKARLFTRMHTGATFGKTDSELEAIFERYYLNTGDYPVITDNFLKKYWVQEPER